MGQPDSTSLNETVSDRGAIAAGHRAEVEAGLRILERGGTAIDALVAAAFAAFVVEPSNCGLAGYGHLSAFLAERGELVTIDHSARGPSESRPDMFRLLASPPPDSYDWPDVADGANVWGCLAPAVPGAVAGLCAAHGLGGRLPLAEVLEPAIELADAGLEVTWKILLAIGERRDEIRAMPAAATLLLPRGDLPRVSSEPGTGDRIDTSALAATLRLIARDGAAGFHGGQVAEAIGRAVTAGGGILTTADIEGYRPRITRESAAEYRGHSYVTANDQVGYEVLNILAQFPLSELAPGSIEAYHLMAEAFGHAFVDNAAHYGDAEYTASPLNGLASPEFARVRAANVSLAHAAQRPLRAGDPWPFEAVGPRPSGAEPRPSSGGVTGTTQVAAADAEGNMAALITTIGGDFGSVVYVPEAGVFLNNGMVNFDPRPDRPNCVEPGKMPFFAVPTIVAVRDGKAAFAAGGSGGYRILAAVVHAFVNVVDFGLSVQEAVAVPRVYCQGNETFVDDRIPVAVRDGLSALGHLVVPERTSPAYEPFARVSAVAADPATGALSAGSDPVWSSAAGAL